MSRNVPITPVSETAGAKEIAAALRKLLNERKSIKIGAVNTLLKYTPYTLLEKSESGVFKYTLTHPKRFYWKGSDEPEPETARGACEWLIRRLTK